MQEKYEPLYHDMLASIQRCQQLDLPEKERAEACFWIASNYWEKLKEFIQAMEFKDECEEIDFFRNVKPEFTSWIEYFVILTESLMFVPTEKLSALNYWEEEARRFKRFCSKNSQFISYYESGNRCNDRVYFMRSSAEDLKHLLTAPVYEVDAKCCTTHDPQVRAYLAQKKFQDYVLNRIKLLTQTN